MRGKIRGELLLITIVMTIDYTSHSTENNKFLDDITPVSYTHLDVYKRQLESIAPEIKKAHKTLTEKSGAGNDFLGWVDLPELSLIHI